jgi:hypothetical protein
MNFRDILMIAATQGGGVPYPGYALAMDFSGGVYRDATGLVSSVSAMAGYAYTRSGAKSELDASGTPVAFAANAPGIILGQGYCSRAALTNLLPKSQEFDSASWGAIDSTGVGSSDPIVTANYATAPDGTLTADRIQLTRGSNGFSRIQQVTASEPVGTYCHSVWMKANTGTPTIGIRCSNSAGANTPTTSAALTSAWQRVTFPVTTTAIGNLSLEIMLWNAIAATSLTADISAWQAQCLAGSDAGPIIVTPGTGEAAIGADSLAVNLTNGSYSAVYTFDDASTQTIPTVIAAGVFTMPVYPTTLNRPLVRSVTLL